MSERLERLAKAFRNPDSVRIGRRDVTLGSVEQGAMLTTLGVVLITLANCAGDVPSYDIAPDPSALEAGTKIEPNAVARAASVLLEHTDTSLASNTTIAGHAGVFLVDNQLVLTTAMHVAKDVSGYDSTATSTSVKIPTGGSSIDFTNTFTWTLDPGTTEAYGTVHDGAVSVSLTADTMGDAYNALVQAVNGQEILPLIPTSYEKLTPGDTLVSIMPDTGQPVSFIYKGHGDNGNYLLLAIQDGRTCEGSSGIPLLRAQVDANGKVTGYTNEAFGTLTAFQPDNIDGAQCETPGNNTYHDYVGFSCFPPSQ